MKVLKRLCIKDWEITAQNGDHFSVEAGKVYTTSGASKEGRVMVFGRYWVRVPSECFTTEGVSVA